MKKPVRKAPVKRRGFQDGGLVEGQQLEPDEEIDVDEEAKKYRGVHNSRGLSWETKMALTRPVTDPRDRMVVSGTAGTTRSKMKELSEAPPPRTELGLARGGKVKKVIPVRKRKRR